MICMNYSIYFVTYYIIGFVICVSYLIYKILTAKVDDDIENTVCFTLTLFILYPIVIPVAIFIWIQKKIKL